MARHERRTRYVVDPELRVRGLDSASGSPTRVRLPDDARGRTLMQVRRSMAGRASRAELLGGGAR
ncbi:hypothetical protein [Streptomyces sp. KL116D]|uniref:hypothetical protein n=1 Tax=Streptomyces sp. KL116D TaxID=3045152 RepID=UPI003556E060